MAWIIKDNRKKYQVECNSCKSIIGFYKDESKFEDYSCFGDWHFHKYINCPACDNKITLSIDGKEVTSIETLD